MQISVGRLRWVIKEEIARLHEASTGPSVPKTISAFRRMIGKAVKKAGGPIDLVDEINDVDYEGDGVSGVLSRVWESVRWELDDTNDADMRDAWRDIVTGYVGDAVIDIVAEYNNKLNYGPGRRASSVDGPALAKSVVAIILGDQAPSKGTVAVSKGQKTDTRRPRSKTAVLSLRKVVAFVRDIIAKFAIVTSTAGDLKDKYEPNQTIRFKNATNPKQVLDHLLDELNVQGYVLDRDSKDFTVYEKNIDGDMIGVDVTFLMDKDVPHVMVFAKPMYDD